MSASKQSNLEAMRRSLKALRSAGRLTEDQDGLVQIALSLAAAVDADPGNASLWREYRMTEKALREVGSDDVDGLELLATALRSALSDEEDRPAK